MLRTVGVGGNIPRYSAHKEFGVKGSSSQGSSFLGGLQGGVGEMGCWT